MAHFCLQIRAKIKHLPAEQVLSFKFAQFPEILLETKGKKCAFSMPWPQLITTLQKSTIVLFLRHSSRENLLLAAGKINISQAAVTFSEGLRIYKCHGKVPMYNKDLVNVREIEVKIGFFMTDPVSKHSNPQDTQQFAATVPAATLALTPTIKGVACGTQTICEAAVQTVENAPDNVTQVNSPNIISDWLTAQLNQVSVVSDRMEAHHSFPMLNALADELNLAAVMNNQRHSKPNMQTMLPSKIGHKHCLDEPLLAYQNAAMKSYNIYARIYNNRALGYSLTRTYLHRIAFNRTEKEAMLTNIFQIAPRKPKKFVRQSQMKSIGVSCETRLLNAHAQTDSLDIAPTMKPIQPAVTEMRRKSVRKKSFSAPKIAKTKTVAESIKKEMTSPALHQQVRQRRPSVNVEREILSTSILVPIRRESGQSPIFRLPNQEPEAAASYSPDFEQSKTDIENETDRGSVRATFKIDSPAESISTEELSDHANRDVISYASEVSSVEDEATIKEIPPSKPINENVVKRHSKSSSTASDASNLQFSSIASEVLPDLADEEQAGSINNEELMNSFNASTRKRGDSVSMVDQKRKSRAESFSESRLDSESPVTKYLTKFRNEKIAKEEARARISSIHTDSVSTYEPSELGSSSG